MVYGVRDQSPKFCLGSGSKTWDTDGITALGLSIKNNIWGYWDHLWDQGSKLSKKLAGSSRKKYPML